MRRAAGLLAVAVIPVVAGLSGDDYTYPAALDPILLSSALLVAGALLAAVLIRGRLGATGADTHIGADTHSDPGVADTTSPRPIGSSAEDRAPAGRPRAADPPQRVRVVDVPHCAVNGPPLHPGTASSPVSGSATRSTPSSPPPLNCALAICRGSLRPVMALTLVAGRRQWIVSRDRKSVV